MEARALIAQGINDTQKAMMAETKRKKEEFEQTIRTVGEMMHRRNKTVLTADMEGRALVMQGINDTQKAMMAEHIHRQDEKIEGLEEELALMTARWAETKRRKEEFEQAVRTVGEMMHQRNMTVLTAEEKRKARRAEEYRRAKWYTKIAMKLEDGAEELLNGFCFHYDQHDRVERIAMVWLLVPMLCALFFAIGRYL